MNINQIAEMIEAEVTGNGDASIIGMAHPAYAEENDLTFATSEATFDLAEKSKAICILTSFDVKKSAKTILKVKDLKIAATLIYNAMVKQGLHREVYIHPSAIISEKAVIGKNVSLGPGVVIGNNAHIGDNTTIEAGSVIREAVTIGKNCYIYPNVTMYKYVEIKDNVIIHAGTVIGSDGFGYTSKDGEIYKVPQMGKVIIEENVEIGANSCVDRGTFDTTVIGRDTKIDNLVQIAHNVKIGQKVFLAAQTGVAGSATIGDYTMTGGQAGISDHINVASKKRIAAKCGVIGHIRQQDADEFFGYPAREARTAFRQMAFLSWLNRNSKKIMKMVKDLPEA
ncbi:MAG: UDP-3-O-(3-hydroxymyristoyl)glucosamine N-acyltransferase [Candidatus Omnitrophota bacterium]